MKTGMDLARSKREIKQVERSIITEKCVDIESRDLFAAKTDKKSFMLHCDMKCEWVSTAKGCYSENENERDGGRV